MRRAANDMGFAWVLLGKNEFDHYGAERFDEIREIMREAATARAMFPAGQPDVFIFKFDLPDRAEGK